MKETPSAYARLLASILKAKHSVEIRLEDRKWAYGKVHIRRRNTQPLIPAYPSIKAAREEKAKKQWLCVDFHVEELAEAIVRKQSRLLRDLIIRPPASDLIRPKLETVLRTSLKDTRARLRTDEEHSHLSSLNDRSNIAGSDLVSLVGERVLINRHITDEGNQCAMITEVDYMLYHGNPEDLEVSVVILRAREVGEDMMKDLLVSMARINDARKAAGEENAEIWGIATDCAQWTFAYIDNKSQCSTRTLSWRQDKTQILRQILQIMWRAIERAANVARSRPGPVVVWRKTQKQGDDNEDDEVHPTGLQILNLKAMRIDSRRDDFTGRLIDFADVWW
ncbi:hypothetical protein BJY01DRAFT_242716 [Aspergillus pseudoustus]|uniref:Uncharacterized protein n=1 Tax=Aspergillus pseudoustus TaxID=1810923 RepID=A0ABR4KWM3_9EURO